MTKINTISFCVQTNGRKLHELHALQKKAHGHSDVFSSFWKTRREPPGPNVGWPLLANAWAHTNTVEPVDHPLRHCHFFFLFAFCSFSTKYWPFEVVTNALPHHCAPPSAAAVEPLSTQWTEKNRVVTKSGGQRKLSASWPGSNLEKKNADSNLSPKLSYSCFRKMYYNGR